MAVSFEPSAADGHSYAFVAQSHSSQAAGEMRPCKVFGVGHFHCLGGFIAVAAVSLSAAAAFLRLPADAGSELTRRTGKAAQAISPAAQ